LPQFLLDIEETEADECSPIGDRVFTQYITFGENLSEVPVVVLGISGLDCTAYPVRVDVAAKNVTIRGFDVEIRTWGETHLWSCVGFWIALPCDAVRGANVDSSQAAKRNESRARVIDRNPQTGTYLGSQQLMKRRTELLL
jgi:hypothetical protein